MSNKKIKIAAVKFAMFASGGTEKFIQTIIANLPKDKFEVDAYYTNAAPYVGNDYKHIDNDQVNIDYVKNHGVNVIPIKVGYKDVSTPTHEWLGTDFYEKFDETKYDMLLTARAGHSEAPCCHLKNIPIIELVTLPGMADRQSNIVKSVHISNFQLQTWVQAGGDVNKSIVIPIVSDLLKMSGDDLRKELKIDEDNGFVFGFHQREDDGIFSPVSLEAYKKVMRDDTWFVIMGGSKLYSRFAEANQLKNFIQIPFSSDPKIKDKFLATLDVFAHARKDGETFGLSISEAMSYGLPILSHAAPAMGHVETIGNAGFVCNSVDEYANYMQRLYNHTEINDMELYGKLAKNAKARYQIEYSVDAAMNKFFEIFDKALTEKQKDKMSDEDFWASV